MFKFIALASTLFFAQSAFAGSMTTSGVPHPATNLCEDKAGETLITKDQTGEHAAVCQFEGGYIELITLFETLFMGKTTQAVAAYLSVQGPRPQIGFLQPGSNDLNPAARLCAEKSGVVKINVLTVRMTGELKMDSFQTCSFSDGSEIGAWTLWHGKDHPLNEKLTTILESGK